MIIECINCNKKFEVNSDLIPNEGRSIQCGSCNHIWFFNKSSLNQDTSIKHNTTDNDEKNKQQNQSKIFEEDAEINEKKIGIKSQEKKIKSTFPLIRFLSYIMVLIISFIALIIILDTFKSFFPNIEFVLFNLFETLKDIKLFIIDLF